jgi:hypothetical protein
MEDVVTTAVTEALNALADFAPNGDVRQRVAGLESSVTRRTGSAVCAFLEQEQIDDELLRAARVVKQVSSQIDVIIHTVGILTALPHILDDDETVLSVSLGAGNTGRRFDLETDRQVAEFKFITWRGGAESIRQNGLFVDLFNLASFYTDRRRCLYVTGAAHPLRFLNGGRAIESVLSKSSTPRLEFQRLYGSRYATVSAYFRDVADRVEIIDLEEIVPGFMRS